jgi:hypothetical protein
MTLEMGPDSSPTVAINSSLTGPHLDSFNHAITNILSTDIAKLTYAQLIDGIPLAKVARDDANRELPNDHPVHKHTELCPGVLERTREFRDSFDPGSLKIDAAVYILSPSHFQLPAC